MIFEEGELANLILWRARSDVAMHMENALPSFGTGVESEPK
jgi:hypothetical protein